MKPGLIRTINVLLTTLIVAAYVPAHAQRNISDTRRNDRRGVRAVTIPVTLRLREPRPQSEMQSIEYLTVMEDGEEQEILSLRGGIRSPLSLAILIQEDLVPSFGNEISGLADFIRRLPQGSRVFIGYLRSGTIQVRQRFTGDLERAAKSLRITISSASFAPYNPYVPTIEALKRFESQPTGRRAVLLISDGVDVSRGVSVSSPAQSLDLQRAINEALRRSVAVYSIYVPTVGGTGTGGSLLVGNGQGALERLSSETGGRAFFQGLSAPVSFNPFLRELNLLLSRQFALTYLSTHPGKGLHRIKIVSAVSEGEIQYPQEYTR
ncbi:MAG TPA: hypothetical protein VF666_05055 [Pyrinomonadaceae bacterium]|jgi:hypothetical protein